MWRLFSYLQFVRIWPGHPGLGRVTTTLKKHMQSSCLEMNNIAVVVVVVVVVLVVYSIYHVASAETKNWDSSDC